MIEGAWPYVIAAYSATGLGLTALVVAIVSGARRWARLARDLEKPK